MRGLLDHFRHRLAHSRQAIGRPVGHRDVIEADHGEVLGDSAAALLPERVEAAEGHDVVGKENPIVMGDVMGGVATFATFN